MNLEHTCFPFFPGSPPTLVIPLKKRRKEKQAQFVLPIYSLDPGQTPSRQHLKESWVLPLLHPCQKPAVEGATLLYPYHSF